MGRTYMATYDLAKGIEAADQDEIWAIRGKAIQSYANLEQALCRIFSHLSGTPLDIAAIIYFRIASTDARDKIVDRLFRKKLKQRFNLFRNSLIDQLRPIHAERNEIVHWNIIIEQSATCFEVVLKPPTFWDFETFTPKKTAPDLVAFANKCGFYASLCGVFHALAFSEIIGMPEDERRPWLDIFEQPITYPPPPTHPLFPKTPAPPSPHRS